MTPTPYHDGNAAQKLSIDQYCAWLRPWAARNVIDLIDANAAVADPADPTAINTDDPDLYASGNHLNDAGHQAIAAAAAAPFLGFAQEPTTTPDDLAAALLDLPDGIETGITLRQAVRAIAAILTGKLSGAGTSEEVFQNIGGTTDRVTVAADSSGRSWISLGAPGKNPSGCG